MMLNKITLTSVLSIVTMITVASATNGDKGMTSKDYVDTSVATKQNKFPASGTAGVGAGSTVMTYTSTSGTIGERALYTDPSSYTAGTDADKLITASALKGAFNNLPTTTTTKLVCQDSPACTLWTITDQTAYGKPPIDPAVMLAALINTNGTDACYKRISDGYTEGNCITPPSKYGDWGATFTYNNETVQVSGISVCRSEYSTSDQSAVQSDYEASGSGEYGRSNPPGKYCTCKMTSPAESSWLSFASYPAASTCAYYCASTCAGKVMSEVGFRTVMFNLVQ